MSEGNRLYILCHWQGKDRIIRAHLCAILFFFVFFLEEPAKPLFSLIPQVLLDAGLIGGADLTPEAALSKLSYVLAKKDLDLVAKKKVGPPLVKK